MLAVSMPVFVLWSCKNKIIPDFPLMKSGPGREPLGPRLCLPDQAVEYTKDTHWKACTHSPVNPIAVEVSKAVPKPLSFRKCEQKTSHLERGTSSSHRFLLTRVNNFFHPECPSDLPSLSSLMLKKKGL